MRASALAAFARLPRGAQPQPHEWTVLAVVLALRDGQPPEPVALGCGNKCGAPHTAADAAPGAALHDSHAEVMARRAFRRFLLRELARGAGSRFLDGRRVREGVRFGLFISEPPCGDASIYAVPAARSVPDGPPPDGPPPDGPRPGAPPTGGPRHGAPPPDGPRPAKRPREAEETDHMRFTGAKLVSQTPEPGAQALGRLRTKSGRSDLPPERRTRSLSCSDKLLRWAALGVQGAALAPLLDPVRFAVVEVAAPPDADRASLLGALRRALVDRLPCGLEPGAEPELRVVDGGEFPFAHEAADARVCAAPGNRTRAAAAGTAVNWSLGDEAPEVTQSATGAPQGAGKKKRTARVSRVSKAAFARDVAAAVGCAGPVSYAELKRGGAAARAEFMAAVAARTGDEWPRTAGEEDGLVVVCVGGEEAGAGAVAGAGAGAA